MRLTALIGVAGVLLFGFAAFADNGYIKARGSPTGAGLFVDGKYLGPAGRFTVPEKYEVAAGQHEVLLADPRYEDYKTTVTVQPKKTTKISYKLKKKEPPKGPFGRLRLGGGEPESFISVAYGDTGPIFLNGKFMGFVDELNNAGGGLLLPAGTYELKVQSQRFGEINQKVTIEPNKVTVIPLKK
jgi:hypothetical protein